MPLKPATNRCWVFVCTVFGVVILAGACSGDNKAPANPTRTSTPATGVAATPLPPNVTPSATVPLLSPGVDAARRLESEGDLEAAAAAYLAAAGDAGDDREDAVLGAARLLIELDRAEEAKGVLESYIGGATEPGAARARFLLARSLAELGETGAAIEQFGLYIQAGLPATPYAYFERAALIAADGNASAAASEAQAGLEYDLPGQVEASAILTMARANESALDLGEALAWYEALLARSGSSADQALALLKLGSIKESLGDPSFLDDYKRLLGEYPSSPQAQEALEALTDSGYAVDPYVRGLVYYRHNLYGPASLAFEEAIAVAPDATATAEAYYYRAAIFEAYGDLDSAVAHYSRVLELNPASFIADDSLWWRARIAEDNGDSAAAEALMLQLVSEYPASSWAGEAAFRGGLLPFRFGSFQAAADIWSQGLSAISDPAERERLTFWQGKSASYSGNPAVATPILATLAYDREDDYYGVRAGSILRGEHGQPKAVADNEADLTPDFDWSGAETWLAAHTGRTLNDAASEQIFSDPRWIRSMELYALGRKSDSYSEGFAAIDAYANDALAMYQAARLLMDRGSISLSARAGQRLLRVLDTNPNQGLPNALLSLSYPAAFGRLVQRHAAEAGVSPLLLLALVRQESFFDPRAESPAGAYGLSQVLPGTAATIASSLGLPAPSPAELKQADLNLRLGSVYLRNQLADFGQQIYTALAAYNAGPNAARRWVAASEGDADLYLELVEFTETRYYIQFVAENYAIYRYLYGGAPAPNLPSD